MKKFRDMVLWKLVGMRQRFDMSSLFHLHGTKWKAQVFFSKSFYLFTKLHGVTSQYIVAFALTSELEISQSSFDFLFRFWWLTFRHHVSEDWRLLGLTPCFRARRYWRLEGTTILGDDGKYASETKRHMHEDRNLQQNFSREPLLSKPVRISGRTPHF